MSLSLLSMHPSLSSTPAAAKILGASCSTNVTRGVVRLSRAMASAGVVFLLFLRLVARVRLPRVVARWRAVFVTAFVLSRTSLPGADKEPFIPRHDAEVVAYLRPAGTPSAERGLRAFRSSLADDPTDLPLALEVAGRLLALARAEADPRHLGHAQTALGPWWDAALPPAPVLVLRAIIRQSLHEFPAALADLDAAISVDPRDARAWLTKATVHTVRGEFDAARRACVPLLRLADRLTATTAAATVASLTGDAAGSVRLLGAALDEAPDAPVATRVWALTQLAETESRLGHAAASERRFRQALALAPGDPYLLGAFADLLLDEHRPDEAAALVAGAVRTDALLLRQAEAQQLGAGSPDAAIGLLDARFAAAHARGDDVHRREEARFRLRSKREPAAALALARANWLVQKEPADARILLESARAAGDAAAEREVLGWVASCRLEDIHLAPGSVASAP